MQSFYNYASICIKIVISHSYKYMWYNPNWRWVTINTLSLFYLWIEVITWYMSGKTYQILQHLYPKSNFLCFNYYLNISIHLQIFLFLYHLFTYHWDFPSPLNILRALSPVLPLLCYSDLCCCCSNYDHVINLIASYSFHYRNSCLHQTRCRKLSFVAISSWSYYNLQ